jgi:hypothetical protein
MQTEIQCAGQLLCLLSFLFLRWWASSRKQVEPGSAREDALL